MADTNSLRVMSIFEACARLECGSELTCLAAHIYHRFFRLRQQMNLYELYTFAAASIKLAHWFYEKQFNCDDLALVMMSIIHRPDFLLDPESHKKLTHSIELAAKIMAINLDFQINYKDTRLTTPGLLKAQNRGHLEGNRNKGAQVIEFSSSESSSSSDQLEDESEWLLNKNDKHQVSSHRYLAHFLKTVQMLVTHEAMEEFTTICNRAWTILSDFHWSPCVTSIYANHLACTSFMIAIEKSRDNLAHSRVKARKDLWTLLDKKWNLIFCDDFSNEHLNRAIRSIKDQYEEYERVIQHELNTYVIDPLGR